MKKNVYAITSLLFSLLVFNQSLSGQVTIGNEEAPAKAGLLQLKNQPADANNVTSTLGGLILSRVELISLSTLEPFISPSDSDYETQKELHVGLIVYQAVSKTDVNDVSITITPGTYIWNGSLWEKLEA